MPDLDRFVDAQRDTYDDALAELTAGRKRSHWMWFIFPQIRGLGSSPTARHYAIADADEARAYLGHAVLGPRLLKCCDAVLQHKDSSATAIFGTPDDLKLRSSVTLFQAVAPEEGRFNDVLVAFFDGKPDPLTLARL